LPSPRLCTTLRAATAASFSGTCIGSSFFVRGTFNIRPLKSTMSHVRLYRLPFRKPVLIARSNSGRCKGHLASMTFRSFPLLQ
jgi:hypothetical protein